jgi:hypothetical protein
MPATKTSLFPHIVGPGSYINLGDLVKRGVFSIEEVPQVKKIVELSS